MRKRIGIGVVAAALLFGLIGPGLSGPARSDQVVAAGIGTDVTEVFRALGRSLRAWLPFIEHDGPELEAAIRELRALVPTVVRLPEGEVRLSERQWWKLIDVGCKAKDVDQIWREDEINQQLWMLAEELPDPIGFAASVRNLADELANAKDSGDRTRVLATARFCGKAATLAHG